MQRSRMGLLVVCLLVVTSACHDDPARNIVGGSPSEAIAVVSGNAQRGRVGAMLDEPFVVRVTNAAGQALGSVAVEWSVTRGGGSVCHSDPVECSDNAVTATGPDGQTRVVLRPALVDRSEVRARLRGAVDASVTFAALIDGVVVHIGPLLDCSPNDPVRFSGPDGSSDTWINGGEVVEWRNLPFNCDSAHIVSTVMPPGGKVVDSGIIPPGGRYEFVPNVSGYWEFSEQRSGARGTLTVW